MNPILELDRNAATLIFGQRADRPTVSRRIGEVISSATGVSPETGTNLFHGVLVVGALVWLAKK